MNKYITSELFNTSDSNLTEYFPIYIERYFPFEIYWEFYDKSNSGNNQVSLNSVSDPTQGILILMGKGNNLDDTVNDFQMFCNAWSTIANPTFDTWHKANIRFYPLTNKLHFYLDRVQVYSDTCNKLKDIGCYLCVLLSPGNGIRNLCILDNEDLQVSLYDSVLLNPHTNSNISVDDLGNLGGSTTSDNTNVPLLYCVSEGATSLGDPESAGFHSRFTGQDSLGYPLSRYMKDIIGSMTSFPIFSSDFTIDIITQFDPYSFPYYTIELYDESDSTHNFRIIFDYSVTRIYIDGTYLLERYFSKHVQLSDALLHTAIIYEKASALLSIWINGEQIVKLSTTGSSYSYNRYHIQRDFQFGIKLRLFRISQNIVRYRNSFKVPESWSKKVPGIDYMTQYTLPIPVEAYFHWEGTAPANYIEPNSGYCQSKFGSSIPFNGQGYLSYDKKITLGGKDFTIDGWFYMSSNSGSYSRIFNIFDTVDSQTSNIALCRMGTSATMYCHYGNNYDSSGVSVTMNALHHFAMVYHHDLGQMKLYIDGTLRTTYTTSIPETIFANFYLGKSAYTADGMLVGSIDEFRISDGIARYMGNFELPIERYYHDQYTKVLLHGDDPEYCHNSDLTDDIGNRYYLDKPFDISTVNAKFNNSIHIPCKVGGLITSTYIFNFTGQSFTIDFWAYVESFLADEGSFSYHPCFFYFNHADNNTSSNDTITKMFYLGRSGDSYLISNVRNGTTTDTQTSAYVNMLNTLSHYAYVYDSGNIKVYVNGVLVINQTVTLSNGKYRISIGSSQKYDLDYKAATNFKGYISEFRISNGVRWADVFEVPTERYQTDTNTLSLLHFDKSWEDSAGKYVWEHQYISYPEVSREVVPFPGGYSLYFKKGSELYTESLNLSKSDFTIEGWSRYGSDTGSYGRIFELLTPGHQEGFLLYSQGNSNRITLDTIASGAGTQRGTWYISHDVWFHWAITYNKRYTTFQFYLNGQRMTSFIWTLPDISIPLKFGRSSWTGDSDFVGYLSDFRISVGIRRYIGNFSVPTKYSYDIESESSSSATADSSISFLDNGNVDNKEMISGNISSDILLKTMINDKICKNGMQIGVTDNFKTIFSGDTICYDNVAVSTIEYPRVVKNSHFSDGSNRALAVASLDYEKVSLSNTLVQNYGNFTTTFTPKENISWLDNSKTPYNMSWSSQQILTSGAIPVMSPSRNIVTYNLYSPATGTFGASSISNTITQTVDNNIVTARRQSTYSGNVSVSKNEGGDSVGQTISVPIKILPTDEFTICYNQFNALDTPFITQDLCADADTAWSYKSDMVWELKSDTGAENSFLGTFICIDIVDLQPDEDWEISADIMFLYSSQNGRAMWMSPNTVYQSLYTYNEIGGIDTATLLTEVCTWHNYRVVYSKSVGSIKAYKDNIEATLLDPYMSKGLKFVYIAHNINKNLYFRARNVVVKRCRYRTTIQDSFSMPLTSNLDWTSTQDGGWSVSFEGGISDRRYDAKYTQYYHVVHRINSLAGLKLTDLTSNVTFKQKTNFLVLKDRQYAQLSPKIVLGGGDFTIECIANLKSTTPSWGRIFEIATSNANGATVIELARNSTSNDIVVYYNNAIRISISNHFDTSHHFAIVYRHDLSRLILFVDGSMAGYSNGINIPSAERTVYLGKSTWSTNEYTDLDIAAFRISNIARYNTNAGHSYPLYDLTSPNESWYVAPPAIALSEQENGKLGITYDSNYMTGYPYESSLPNIYPYKFYLHNTAREAWSDGSITPREGTYEITTRTAGADLTYHYSDIINVTSEDYSFTNNMSSMIKSGAYIKSFEYTNSCLMNSDATYQVNVSCYSDFWIRFQTKYRMYIGLSCSISSTPTYAVGKVTLSTTPQNPTYNKAVGKDGVIYTISGEVSDGNLTPDSVIVEPGTLYYLGLHYIKSGKNKTSGSDRFKISNIRLAMCRAIKDIYNHTVETSGVSITSEQKLYGAGSIKFTNPSKLTIQDVGMPNSATGSSGSFTLEFWFYLSGHPGNEACIVSNNPDKFLWKMKGTSNRTELKFGGNSTSYSLTDQSTGAEITISYGQWHHIAFTYKYVSATASRFRVFYDGKVVFYNNTDITNFLSAANVTLCFGYNVNANSYYCSNLYIYDIKESYRERYTADFTPPQTELGKQSYTNVLIHY